jgi:hypothetical protein
VSPFGSHRLYSITDQGAQLRSKTLIGRLLNTTEHNGTNDCDGDCPNACKDEGSHDRPSLCLRNGSIRIPPQCPLWVASRHLHCKKSCLLHLRKRTFAVHSPCPLWANSGHQSSFEQSRGLIFFSAAYFADTSMTIGSVKVSSAVYQPEITFHILPSHCCTRAVLAPS